MIDPLQPPAMHRPKPSVPDAIKGEIRSVLSRKGGLQRMRDFAEMVRAEGSQTVVGRIEAKLAERGFTLDTTQIAALEARLAAFANRMERASSRSQSATASVVIGGPTDHIRIFNVKGRAEGESRSR